MIRKIKCFFALSFEEKRIFLEAYILLGFIRSALLLTSFKHLTRSLCHSTDQISSAALTEDQQKTARLIGRAIIRAANNTPWESACLAQALVAHKMLKRRGIPGVFYLGVMKDQSLNDKMQAHAWSQCGEAIITGEDGHESFTVLSTFGWGQR